MSGSLELEPTAALVMDWAKDLYRTGIASSFVARLDLSAGQRMRQECDAVCPWYPEVMMNRKWFIRHIASTIINSRGFPCQILILASGKSPLALELLERCPGVIVSVIETDIAGMEEKARIYREVAPTAAQRIRCVEADLYDPGGTRDAVADTGAFYPDRPTIIVFEGISYYLPPEISSGVLSRFTSKSGQNTVILDSLLPCRLVREDRRYISRGIWSIIHRDCNVKKTVTYCPDEMVRMLISAGGGQVRHHAMNEMEWLRTGENRYFPTDGDGWIRISTARL
ncbi:O-methyltransferase involved in polyketide biosynthesis [Methanolinea mesophila]|uniref:class I SAM-dependent methyltransferase n=1 Tax=Methanolinea mesophila TaxID=547055 RepID=UPI001AE42285|nr:class I SAM-dependent methyltransferase [Methanolinea mesophila]MBP1929176.1 O-methyltransferase involved in polyketide biosynthesis [Methanolinea mesophila]